MVGMRKDLNLIFRPPAPTHLKKLKSCKDAIEKPPIGHGASNHELTKQHPRVVERLKHIRPGENAWTANIPDELKLNVTGAQISQIYKRLDPSKPAYTITGSGGGGTHVYHWAEDRALTNRERARLQTFPDSFIFEGTKESVRRQIGMAVPPDGAKVLFEAIAKTLAHMPYESVKSNH
jgi:DNA (cytosine-5)-methyltransferase 1